MYTVKTYLDKSPIEGIGVFAGEDIKKGDIVWRYVEGFDQVFEVAEVEKMPPVMKAVVKRHGYLWQGKIYYAADHGKFTNHADDANTVEGNGNFDIAVRDIRHGEELTCNYRQFDGWVEEKLS